MQPKPWKTISLFKLAQYQRNIETKKAAHLAAFLFRNIFNSSRRKRLMPSQDLQLSPQHLLNQYANE